MPRSMTAAPGPWKNERTPYLVGIMDAVAEPDIEQVVFLKAVQVGFSEALRNVLGYWIDHDPGPALQVMPTQQAAEELVDERIRPLLAETPKLREYVSSDRTDNKVHHTRLSSMSVFIGWAGSPQALASRPIRYVVFDEVDKYPAFSGKEADPISLGLKRLTTYGTRARAIIGSTPTTRHGPVWQAWERCTQRRHFEVPCPKCGHRQRLNWSRVRWPERGDGETRAEQAERVEAGELARYHCESCDAAWTTAEKVKAVRGGEWVSDGGSPRRVGFHLNSIYSPWVSLSKLAAEWIAAQGSPSALMDFANSRLAEPFEEQSSSTKADTIADKRPLSGPPMVLPEWASYVFLTADVQKDHLYYVIRAWGAGGRSQMVRYGIVSSFAELTRVGFGGEIADARGQAVPVSCASVDARYRRDEALAWCAEDPARRKPFFGAANANGRAMPMTQNVIKGYNGVVGFTLNTDHFKDILHSRIHNDDPTYWLPHREAGDDYCKQMASEHKVFDPKAGVYRWVQVSAGNDNHIWDCEAAQCVLAQMLNVDMLEDIPPQRAAETRRDDGGAGNWATDYGGTW